MLSKITLFNFILTTNAVIIVFISYSSAESKESISLRSRAYGRDCVEATADSGSSGVHEILVPSYSDEPFKVACDATTQGGGWTVILRRTDGSVDFYRDWNSYKNGFGDLENEFFLGLDKIHAITTERSHELLVVVEDFKGTEKFERYTKFAIGEEYDKYILYSLGIPSGTAGDSLNVHHGQKFSTYDRDNDEDSGNCAKYYTGAWWFHRCYDSHLTGPYKRNGKAINWYTFGGSYGTLKRAAMMIRPRT